MVHNNSSINMYNLLSYMGYTFGGTVIGTGNLIIFLSLAKYEALRSTNIYILIMALSLADATNMAGFVIAGIRRSLLILNEEHDYLYTPWKCALMPHNIIWSFSFVVANSMLGVISIDRLLSVLFPLEHIGWSSKYVLFMVGVVYLYGIGSGVVGLIWSYTTKDDVPSIPARCIAHQTLGSFNKYYEIHYNEAPIVLALFSLFIYIIVWIIYKRRNNQVSPGTKSQQQQVDHDRKFTKSLAISCVCTFFLFIVPYQMAVFINKFYPDYETLPLVFWNMSNLNPLANVIIYSKRHKEIRQSVVGLFTCKPMPIDIKMWKMNTRATKSKFAARSGGRNIHVQPKQQDQQL